MVARSLRIALLSLLPSACASAPPAKPPPVSDPTPPASAPAQAKDDGDDDGMKVEGTLGTLEEEAIQAGLAPRLQAISACFEARAKHEPFLSGKLTLHFRVGRDGSVVRMRLSESTLGSVAVERCIVKAASGVGFRSPRGGEAEFGYPLTFQGRMRTLEWNAGNVKDELLAAVSNLLDDGKGGVLTAPPGLSLTFYIDVKGKAVSAGMIADAPIDDRFADRFVTNLKKLKFVAPSGSYAKVTYTW